MRSGLLAAMAVTTLAGALAVPGVAAATTTAAAPTGTATPAGWAPTGTLAEPTGGLTATGPLAATTPMQVTVALAPQQATLLRRDVAAGDTMSAAQVASEFDPTSASVSAVESYLTSQGFSAVTATPDNVLVNATGTAATVSKAFDTTLGAFTVAGRTVFANTAAAEVPSSLAGTVSAVLGLNSLATMTTAPMPRTSATTPSAPPLPTSIPSSIPPAVPTAAPSGLPTAAPTSVPTTALPTATPSVPAVLPTASASPTSSAGARNQPRTCVVPGVGYPCTYNPQGFQQAYDATSAPTGSRTNIAIFAEGDLTQVVEDLRQEEAANRLPQVRYSIVRTGIPSSDTSGADEWDLDTQYSTGMAQTVNRLYLYDATSLTDSDLANSFDDFVSQDVAKAGSASFGECEFQAYLDGSMLTDDMAFARAALQGQTVFASAGDTGGFCPVAPNNGVPAGVLDVNYPASSPYVVGVGGTSLVTNADGSYDNEIAWTAGGGGVSYFENAPAWQATDGYVGKGVTTVCGAQAALGCGRTVPDVSMAADPNSGANVYVDGTPEGVGGTSLASPLSLGVWARVESAHGNGIGFAAPVLYKAQGTSVFHDITLGDTGPYPATPGYDLATGLGTFDVAQAAKAL